MKKLLLLILVLAMTLSVFAACNSKEDETTEGTTASATEAKTDASSEETTNDDETTSGEETSTPDEGGEETVLESAMAYIHQLYKDMKPATQSSYNLVKSVDINGTVCAVVWTIEGTDLITITENQDNTVTVNIPEAGDSVIEYKLKATITVDGETASREYEHNVPKFKVHTFAEYAAAADGDAVTIEGIVSGVFSKTTGSTANGLYIQDAKNEGGYYVYNLTDDPNGTIEVGMTVQVKGEKDIYNGTYEVINASVKVLNDGTKTEVTPVDYTEIIKNAEKLTDAALIEKQGMLVTIKDVTIDEVVEANGYYYFLIGNHKVYLRISTSNNATDKASLATIKQNFADHRGDTADATGIISLYNGSFYLSPVSADAFTNFKQPERNDKQKAEFELGAINFDEKITSDKTYDLVVKGTTYDNVTIEWAVEGEGAAIADGKLAIKIPDNGSTITVKATATCGSETATATWTIKASKAITSIKDALAIAGEQSENGYTADKYLVGGIIKEIKSDVYGNCYIKDADGNEIYIYGLYSADGIKKYSELEVKPQVGDYIVVLGVLGKYNGSIQIKSGWVITHTTTTSIKDALEVGNAVTTDNTYSENKYLVTGTITEFAKNGETYGNFYIVDAEGNKIYVYGLYDATGATRYDALAYKPQVGDTVTILGVVGKYKVSGEVQMKNTWLIDLAKAEAKVPNISESAGCGMSPDEYFENDKSIQNSQAAAWLKENRADGIKGVESVGFRGWVGLGDKTIASFGYAINDGEIVWSESFFADTEPTLAGAAGQPNVKRYKITVDLKDLTKAGDYIITLYVKASDDTVYVLDKWCELKVVVENKPVGPYTGTSLDMSKFAAADATVKDNSYAERVTADGWKVINAAQSKALAETDALYGKATSYIVLNGKTSTPGKLTSATIANGISKISFKTGFPFGDDKYSLTVNIIKNGETVATKTFERTDLAQGSVCDETWTLDTAVEGEFVIEIVNNCLSRATKNKDRVAIFDLTWENA